MSKFATNVILHGSGSVTNNSSKPQKPLRPPSPKTDLTFLKAKPSVDMTKGVPSPKSSTVASRLHQRKSPHLFQDHNNAERTSHLGRPEDHAPWLSLSQHENYDSFDAEQQSHLSVVLQPEHHRQFRQLIENQKLQSAALGSSVSPHTTSGSGSLRPLRKAVLGETFTVDPVVDSHAAETTVGAHTAASTHHIAVGLLNNESMDEAMSDRTQPVEYNNGQSVEQLSVAEILSMQSLLQRELERRIGHAHTNMYPTAAVNVSTVEIAVDAVAIESRRGLKRSKSGGNDSAFVKAAPSPSTTTTATNPFPQQQQIRVSNPLSKLTAALADQHENDDPELHNLTLTQSLSTRPGSRASGAFHPHDKMFLANHMRSTSALPCLSPAQLPASASSPFENGNGHGGFSSHGSSRPSSRPPSRGPFGGLNSTSNSHNGHLLMSLLPADQTMTSTNSNGDRQQQTMTMAGSPSQAGIDVSHLSLEATGPEILTVAPAASSPMVMSQESNNRYNTAASGVTSRQHNVSQIQQQEQQQHASRGELLLSPCSAFDDISLGSTSLSSSISSKAQRRRRHREQSEGSNSSVKGQQGYGGLPESISISMNNNRVMSSSSSSTAATATGVGSKMGISSSGRR